MRAQARRSPPTPRFLSNRAYNTILYWTWLLHGRRGGGRRLEESTGGRGVPSMSHMQCGTSARGGPVSPRAHPGAPWRAQGRTLACPGAHTGAPWRTLARTRAHPGAPWRGLGHVACNVACSVVIYHDTATDIAADNAPRLALVRLRGAKVHAGAPKEPPWRALARQGARDIGTANK